MFQAGGSAAGSVLRGHPGQSKDLEPVLSGVGAGGYSLQPGIVQKAGATDRLALRCPTSDLGARAEAEAAAVAPLVLGIKDDFSPGWPSKGGEG
jgi:hypothetical protein